MIAAKKDILQGWKDIAVYVSRDVRTVRRWEKQRGLPVRRMPGDGRANVYALIPELDSWLSATGTAEEKILQEASITDRLPAETAFSSSHAFSRSSQSHLLRPLFRTRRFRFVAAAGILCISAITAFAFGVRAHRRDRAAVDTHTFSATQAMHGFQYSSRIPGVDTLYLRGIFYYEQRTPDTLQRALECFQQAIAKDPGFAPAYVGLAETYNLLREHSTMPEAEAYEKAKAAAEHAIALDPNLAEAHASLGFVQFFWDWNRTAAEHEFETSIALDPNSSLVHHWYGSMLMHEGRFDESLAQLDIAQHLEPTSRAIVSDRAYALALSGHRDEAFDMLQAVINNDAQSPEPHFIASNLSLMEPRDIPRYFSESRRYATLRHDPQQLHMLDVVEPAYRKGGTTALWRAILDEQQSLHPSPSDRTMEMANAEAALGLDDDCLRDLSQLSAARNPTAIGIAIDPFFNHLHQDPRFTSIVAAVGLPPPH